MEAFNHRLRWDNGFVAQSLAQAAEDLRDLIRFLRDNASPLAVDTERMCVVAFSAGGPLLAAPIRAPPRAVRCIVGLYSYLRNPRPGSTDGPQYSAIEALSANARRVPMFVAKAGKDTALINDSIDTFAARARELGAPIEVATHPEGAHGFDILNDDDTARAIIRRCVEFIASHLGG
jgi:dienelactone hydrolase